MTEPSPPVRSLAEERVELLEHYQEFERNFRKDHFPLWLGTLIGPWLVSFALIGVIWVIRGFAYTRALVTAATIAFLFAGRFIILMEGVGDIGKHLDATQVFWLVTYL